MTKQLADGDRRAWVIRVDHSKREEAVDVVVEPDLPSTWSDSRTVAVTGLLTEAMWNGVPGVTGTPFSTFASP